MYTAEYFSDSLAIVDVDSKGQHRPRSLLLDPQNPMTAVRKDETLFNDATICFQQWQSCASCHPGGGRLDGLNWDLVNDGIGNPKNTKSLLLVHKTPLPNVAMPTTSAMNDTILLTSLQLRSVSLLEFLYRLSYFLNFCLKVPQLPLGHLHL